MQLKALHPVFACEIQGVDISGDLDDLQIQQIAAAIDLYAVVVFRRQPLTVEQQIRFARRFGPVETSTLQARKDNKHRTPFPEIADIGNVDDGDRIQGTLHRMRIQNLGNRLWHTDSSYRPLRGALSMLYGRVVPPEGGDTQFADMRAAYDALPEKMKAQLEGLAADHDRYFGRGQLGITDFSPEEIAAYPPARHKLVQVHATSGRKTLYLASHAREVIGWTIPDGRVFLRELMEMATQREFVYAHRWQAGDLVIWDNRCTMHRASAFDESQRRELSRVTTSDVGYVSEPREAAAA